MLTCDIMTCLHFKPETHSIKWICHVACSSRQSQSRKLFLTSIYQILMSQQEFLVQKRKSTKINENEQYRKLKKLFSFSMFACSSMHSFDVYNWSVWKANIRDLFFQSCSHIFAIVYVIEMKWFSTTITYLDKMRAPYGFHVDTNWCIYRKIDSPGRKLTSILHQVMHMQ